MKVLFQLGLPLLVLGMGACSSTYYLVKDPVSGREYYTTQIEHSGDKVTFRDDKSAATVSLQNSEITKITSDQYRANTGAPR